MLQLRVIAPADRTDEVVHLIGRTVGTTHLVVLAGTLTLLAQKGLWATQRGRMSKPGRPC